MGGVRSVGEPSGGARCEARRRPRLVPVVFGGRCLRRAEDASSAWDVFMGFYMILGEGLGGGSSVLGRERGEVAAARVRALVVHVLNAGRKLDRE